MVFVEKSIQGPGAPANVHDKGRFEHKEDLSEHSRRWQAAQLGP
jgi:hypothetical protein